VHVPDGLVYASTALGTWVLGGGVIAYSLKKSREDLEKGSSEGAGEDVLADRRIPVVGLTAAFIFAAQMVAVPIAGGTSAHLLGGAMAGIMLGPWIGTLVMAVVYLVQAIGFADGGITAYGANVLGMGVLPAIGGYYFFRAVTVLLPRTRVVYLGTVALTSFLSVILASALISCLIVFGGPLPLATFPIMIGVHVLVGIIEAGISTAVLAAVLNTRPDLLVNQDRLPVKNSGGEEVTA
jgi:cobalt/nickel transport system permease protein